MSLQQTFNQSNKGDGIFRISENPVKYSDKTFQDSLNANNPKKANSTIKKAVPTSQLAAGDKASASVPGK